MLERTSSESRIRAQDPSEARIAREQRKHPELTREQAIEAIRDQRVEMRRRHKAGEHFGAGHYFVGRFRTERMGL